MATRHDRRAARWRVSGSSNSRLRSTRRRRASSRFRVSTRSTWLKAKHSPSPRKDRLATALSDNPPLGTHPLRLPRSRFVPDQAAAPTRKAARNCREQVRAAASLRTRGRTVPERPALGRPARPGRHAWHSKAVGSAARAPLAEHTHERTQCRRTGPTQGGPRAVAWQVPLDFHPRHCPLRFPPGLARPVTAGPVYVKTGRPRTPRAAALSGSSTGRPVFPL
jgi:hypothetical protein